ncbi:hypothetical protein LNKW23_19040 [Paralimibaculum aggregatum]|uniref:Uncharacterized protein n=1 Tax=Paralimibaculum aggregatum TaxID=3036245 RepID=A0ABQ6LJU8_9RHOB|nr:hypothetical protein LNKW23_19040 [Limibaculum sp. NKW23]
MRAPRGTSSLRNPITAGPWAPRARAVSAMTSPPPRPPKIARSTLAAPDIAYPVPGLIDAPLSTSRRADTLRDKPAAGQAR